MTVKEVLIRLNKIKDKITLLKEENSKLKERIAILEKENKILKIGNAPTSVKISNEKSTIHYRFGYTTEAIKNKLLEFIDKCYDIAKFDGVEYEIQVDNVENFSQREKASFVNLLCSISYLNEPIVRFNSGRFITQYDRDFLKSYSTQEI